MFLREVSQEWVAFWNSEFIRKLANFERKERKSKFVIFYVSVLKYFIYISGPYTMLTHTVKTVAFHVAWK